MVFLLTFVYSNIIGIYNDSSIFNINIPTRKMNATDIDYLQLICSQDSYCSYVAGLEFGGLNANTAFLELLNSNPPSTLQLDVHYSLFDLLNNQTVGQVNDELNVLLLIKYLSIISGGCQLDQVPTVGPNSVFTCVTNPTVSVITHSNRDTLIIVSLWTFCLIAAVSNVVFYYNSEIFVKKLRSIDRRLFY